MNSQDQLDPETLRYISENAAVEHTLLTPFRWLIGAGKFVIGMGLLLAWFAFTLFGWTIDVGEYSLENRREAVCDYRAYMSSCDMGDFKAQHPHTDYEWDFSRALWSGTTPDAHPVDDPRDVAHDIAQFHYPHEFDPKPSPWLTIFTGTTFFPRSDDVFRRKSAQMDWALKYAFFAQQELIHTIAYEKVIDPTKVRLPDAPDIILRRGVMPRGYGNKPVTWGMCLKQECFEDEANEGLNSDLNYALYWGDVLWTKPALNKHQQDAVDALSRLETLDYWLKAAHANGLHEDTEVQWKFRDFQYNWENYENLPTPEE